MAQGPETRRGRRVSNRITAVGRSTGRPPGPQRLGIRKIILSFRFWVRCCAPSVAQPLFIAHRGASAEAPENTLAAFRRALALGVDGIELDVQVSRDGVPMVFHDATLVRLTGRRGRIGQFTRCELRANPVRGEAIPTLAEVLALTRDRAVVQVEIKRGVPVAPVVEAIRRLGPLLAVVLASFEHPNRGGGAPPGAASPAHADSRGWGTLADNRPRGAGPGSSPVLGLPLWSLRRQPGSSSDSSARIHRGLETPRILRLVLDGESTARHAASRPLGRRCHSLRQSGVAKINPRRLRMSSPMQPSSSNQALLLQPVSGDPASWQAIPVMWPSLRPACGFIPRSDRASLDDHSPRSPVCRLRLSGVRSSRPGSSKAPRISTPPTRRGNGASRPSRPRRCC
jgi:hypothetical protein